MTPWMIFKFLAGRREAILSIASTRWSLLVGAILVLSGSLARNYDGLWIPEEWPGLLHGIIVSTANAFILFAFVWVGCGGRMGRFPFFRGYLAFLGLFWMTAPMAWVYGIPYERFLSPLDALHANMWSLAAVSIWRVVLITRVLAVIFGVKMRRTFWFVMFFSDALLLTALHFAPVPVIDFMGGMQQSPQERELASTAFLAGLVGSVTLLVWFVGALWATSGPPVSWIPISPPKPDRPPLGAISLAITAVLAWAAAAIFVAQPEQRLRFEAERLLRAGEIDAALAKMSEHARADYPPMWDPPPRPAWRINTPSVEALRLTLVNRRYAGWVETLCWEKCWHDLAVARFAWTPLESWSAYIKPEWPGPEWLVSAQLHADHDPRLTDEQRGYLRAAIEAGKVPSPRQEPPAQVPGGTQAPPLY